MTLEDLEVRRLAIDLLTAQTVRDKQRRIGASNLSNGCDFCLASNLLGDMRDTPMLDRAWGGRTIGTAIHSLLEERALEVQRAQSLLVEYRMKIGTLGTYGDINSTTDLVIPNEQHALDWKGSTLAKIALIQDFMARQRGEEPPYGRLHKVHKAKPLSERAYELEMVKMEYKMTGYYGQLQLYGLGLNRNDIPVHRLSNVYIARDATMWFDNPAMEGFTDPSRTHGIAVVSFKYSEEVALQYWERGVYIWNALEGGASVNDFKHNEHCFVCGLDARDAEPVEHQPKTPVAEVTFGVAA